MNRRALLVGAATFPVPLAGCGRSASPTETSTVTPTPTPAPPEGFGGLLPGETCDPVTLPRADAAAYPTFDGVGDAAAARDFAGRFERALVDAHLRADARADGRRVTANDVELEAATVREAGGGYVVRTHVSGAAVVRDGTTLATRTPTPIPSVPYDVTAAYYLADRFAVRRERESEVGDLPEGVVACA